MAFKLNNLASEILASLQEIAVKHFQRNKLMIYCVSSKLKWSFYIIAVIHINWHVLVVYWWICNGNRHKMGAPNEMFFLTSNSGGGSDGNDFYMKSTISVFACEILLVRGLEFNLLWHLFVPRIRWNLTISQHQLVVSNKKCYLNSERCQRASGREIRNRYVDWCWQTKWQGIYSDDK